MPELQCYAALAPAASDVNKVSDPEPDPDPHLLAAWTWIQIQEA
jgi:hypothetical protein